MTKIFVNTGWSSSWLQCHVTNKTTGLRSGNINSITVSISYFSLSFVVFIQRRRS